MDLSLVETEEMFRELKERFDTFVFCASMSLDKENERVVSYWHGGKAGVIVLCKVMEKTLLDSLEDNLERTQF